MSQISVVRNEFEGKNFPQKNILWCPVGVLRCVHIVKSRNARQAYVCLFDVVVRDFIHFPNEVEFRSARP